MNVKIFTSLLLFGITSQVFALTPAKEFVKKENFDEVTNFRNESEDIDLTVLKSDLEFSDLSPQGIKEMNAEMNLKKEYGKLLGLSDWTPVKQKVVEENGSRTFLLEGHYKDSENKTVNFLEVYYADKSSSGQFLVTSNSKKISMDEYKRFFNP